MRIFHLALIVFVIVGCSEFKKEKTVSLLDCDDQVLVIGEVDEFESKLGVWNYPNTDFRTKEWINKENNNWQFSLLKDWEILEDEAYGIELNTTGSIGESGGQFIFWCSDTTVNIDMIDLVREKRASLEEEDSSTVLIYGNIEGNLSFCEYNYTRNGSEEAVVLFDLIYQDDSKIVNTGYYFVGENRDDHLLNFIEHLMDVRYKGNKLFNLNELIVVSPSNICYVEYDERFVTGS